MARLRCLRLEANGSDDGFCQHTAEPSGRDVPKLRSSSRKKPVARYTDRNDSEDDASDMTALKPKVSTQIPSNGRQIQLTSLRPLLGSAAAPVDFGAFDDTRPPRNTLKIMRAGEPRPLKALDRHRGIYNVDFDTECFNNDDTDGSDDDLPSPWKLLGLPQKPQMTAPTAPVTVGDLMRDVESLSLVTVPESALGHSSTPRKPDQDPPPCQPNESDAEDLAAFLRFSPPRLSSIAPTREALNRSATPPPQSPSKSRLQSPSKTKPKIPSPHLRDSLDAFWNADTINDWNDQYSPQKPLRSPKKLKFPSSENQGSPTSSPKKGSSPTKRTKAELDRRKQFDAHKHEIAETFLAELDSQVAEGKIGELARSTGGVRFVWSKTLNSTAGRANWRRETTKTRQPDGSIAQTHKHHASIELAEKVIDDEHRLLNVIAHEFCHLCNFMISGIKDQPHGAQFKIWGRKCTAAFGRRGVEVTTKHSYEIDYKYVWQCSNGECRAEFRRHSKSIDPRRHTCGSCHSKIVQIKPIPRKESSATTGGYAAFVKEHFANTKKGMAGASHKEVMEAIGRKYRAEKSSKAASSTVSLDDSGRASSTPDRESSDAVDKVARVLEFVTLTGEV